MEEKKNYENYTEEQGNFVEQMPQGEPKWFSDDFEASYRKATSPTRSLSIYRPREKKWRRILKNPIFASIISSVLTCALCLGIFSAVYRPEVMDSGRILPAPGEAAAARGYGGDVINVVAGTTDRQFGIPEVYDLASPAVVSILCKSDGGGYIQSQLSSGSGIILRPDGYIVTNNHVIESASEISISTIAGQTFEASLVGRDERTDLAVLKVSCETALPFAELGDSSLIRVGEMALAIGNPLREELAGTLTVGYISAINRSMVIDGKQMTMIQTDAAINPGNSGGALLNMRGQVVGINTAKSTGYDVEGLGFAIPINEAKPIIESIIQNGYVTGRPVIGIQGRDVTEAISKANNLPVGVYVQVVNPGGGADKAGMMRGDVILSCDGQTITTIDELNKIKDAHKVGDTLEMVVDRNGKRVTLRVVIQEEKPVEEEKEPEQEQQPQQSSPFSQQLPFPFSWFGW